MIGSQPTFMASVSLLIGFRATDLFLREYMGSSLALFVILESEGYNLFHIIYKKEIFHKSLS